MINDNYFNHKHINIEKNRVVPDHYYWGGGDDSDFN